MINPVSPKHEFLKYLIFPILIYLLLTCSACSIGKSFHIENHLGLYKLVDKKCSVAANAFNPCDSTYFLELVKGQFAGIGESDIAYVFWSGDPNINPELQYTAQRLISGAASKLADNKLWLENESNAKEYFDFSQGRLSRYYLEVIGGDHTFSRKIEYTLMPAKRNNEPRFRLNYPGNR